jgi:hypothetical protein
MLMANMVEEIRGKSREGGGEGRLRKEVAAVVKEEMVEEEVERARGRQKGEEGRQRARKRASERSIRTLATFFVVGTENSGRKKETERGGGGEGEGEGERQIHTSGTCVLRARDAEGNDERRR